MGWDIKCNRICSPSQNFIVGYASQSIWHAIFTAVAAICYEFDSASTRSPSAAPSLSRRSARISRCSAK